MAGRSRLSELAAAGTAAEADLLSQYRLSALREVVEPDF